MKRACALVKSVGIAQGEEPEKRGGADESKEEGSNVHPLWPTPKATTINANAMKSESETQVPCISVEN